MAKFGDGGRARQVLLLREVAEAGQEADRRSGRLHLRRVHRAVQRHHRRGALRDLRGPLRGPAQAPGDLRVPERLRHRPGAGEEDPLGRGLQPLQAGPGGQLRRRRRRAREVEHLAARPDRLRQDPPRPDAGPDAERAVRHRRRHGAHRGRLRRRGRREHPPQADPGRRLRREEGRDRDHLHRRDRQDRPQEREPVDHPRRLGRGRPAGAAQDPRGDDGVGPAPGRAQAPAPGVHPDRHDEHPVHLRRGVRRPRPDHREPRRARQGSAFAPTSAAAEDRDESESARRRSSPRTC